MVLDFRAYVSNLSKLTPREFQAWLEDDTSNELIDWLLADTPKDKDARDEAVQKLLHKMIIDKE